MPTFFARLEQLARQRNSLLCVGLDPHPADLPAQNAEAALDYCLRLVKATLAHAIAFKPNVAFFEVYGASGWDALHKLLDSIRTLSAATGVSIPIVLDAKRGDISSTAEAYARAAFEGLGADAITLNPYLGRDAIQPFLAYNEKGVFLLCKTSNPGAADLQDLPVGNGTLYEQVASLAQSWNTSDQIGLVVGANQPDALQRVRTAASGLWFLAPGVGAQGGDLQTALNNGLRADGLGLLITVSRSLAQASDPAEYACAFNQQVADLRKGTFGS